MKLQLYHSEHGKVIKYEQEVEVTKEIVNFFSTGVLRHTFDFRSVYHHNVNDPGKVLEKSWKSPGKILESPVSTHQDEWILVDYIFYSDESKKTTDSTELQLLGYLSLPTANECESVKLKIPNQSSGSDHLSLLAQFKLCFDSTTPNPITAKNSPPNSNKL